MPELEPSGEVRARSAPVIAGEPVEQSKIINHKSYIERAFAYRRLLVLAAIVFGLDQLTKYWINARLPFGTYGPGGSIEVFPHFFYLVHVGNTGAAWSMFAGASLWLALLAAGTLVAIF